MSAIITIAFSVSPEATVAKGKSPLKNMSFATMLAV